MTYKQSRLRVSLASPEGWALIGATTWKKKKKILFACQRMRDDQASPYHFAV